MPFTIWNTVQACVWFASRDNVAVSGLPNYTFAALAFHVEMELFDSDDDDHTVAVEGMTLGQLLKLRDQIAKNFGPHNADKPGTAWIEGAQRELLGACARGALKMTGRPLYGGPSREIPAEAFATFRFFERDGVDCLGPPDLVDADCWRDLRLLAEDVRRVWPADGSADAATVPSREYGGKASESDHDAWFTSYRDACIAAGKSPNSKADEIAGREALGSRFDRTRARASRRRLAPSDWLAPGKRTGKT